MTTENIHWLVFIRTNFLKYKMHLNIYVVPVICSFLTLYQVTKTCGVSLNKNIFVLAIVQKLLGQKLLLYYETYLVSHDIK